MGNTSQRATGGRHRKVTAPAVSGRNLGLAALAVGVVSTSGVGGAAAATVQAQGQTPAEHSGAGYAPVVDTAASDGTPDSAPQILAIEEYKPATGVEGHLDRVVEYHNATLAERFGPEVVKPAEGTYTSGFEMRWGSFHAGVDIANAPGTPIHAAMDGTVIDSGPASGYGQWIRLLHEDGTVTVYGHMNTLDVSVGDRVTAGQKIAGMGNQGFSTGDHLHFEVHPGGGPAVDPQPWLAEHGISL